MAVVQQDRLERPALVTVVVPTYDRASLVLDAVHSIIHQTYPHWELFVVDDGSTDETVERLEALAEPRLKVIRLQHSGNMAMLRNAGAAAGSGDYVAFLDSDDLWVPTRLEIQLRALGATSDSWSYADVGHIDAFDQSVPMRSGRFRPASGRIARDLLLEQTGVHVITLLVPRRLFVSIGGFDEALLGQADVDLALRLAEAASAVAIPDILALVREHEGRATRGRADPHEFAAAVFEKAAARATDVGIAKLARRRWTEHLAMAGAGRLGRGEVARGGALFWRALVNRANPVSWTRWLGSGLLRLAKLRG